MSEKRKNCLLLAAVILLVAGLAVTGILLPDQQISLTERRSLAQLPTVSVSLVLDKSFSEAFDLSLIHISCYDAVAPFYKEAYKGTGRTTRTTGRSTGRGKAAAGTSRAKAGSARGRAKKTAAE